MRIQLMMMACNGKSNNKNSISVENCLSDEELHFERNSYFSFFTQYRYLVL